MSVGLSAQIRAVLASAAGGHAPLSAYEIFDRLACREALLAECAREADPSEAYELAVVQVSQALLRQLGPEIDFEVVDRTGLSIVYRLRKPALQ
jgi:hypothetical protein